MLSLPWSLGSCMGPLGARRVRAAPAWGGCCQSSRGRVVQDVAPHPHPEDMLKTGTEATLQAAISVPMPELPPSHGTHTTYLGTSRYPWLLAAGSELPCSSGKPHYVNTQGA